MVLACDVAATEFVGNARLPAGRAGFRGRLFFQRLALKSGIFLGDFILAVCYAKKRLGVRIGLASLGGNANATP